MAQSSLFRFASVMAVLSSMTLTGCSEKLPHGKSESPGEALESPSEVVPTGKSRLRAVYVPAYSHLPASKESKHLLSILLSVRNVDPSAVVTLTHVDYFDTSGHRVRRYLRRPKQLRPLDTAEFTVETFDDAGGSGANFLIYWEGPSDAHPLLTESVMLGNMGASYISFTSRGVELDRRPDPSSFMVDAPSNSARSGDNKSSLTP